MKLSVFACCACLIYVVSARVVLIKYVQVVVPATEEPQPVQESIPESIQQIQPADDNMNTYNGPYYLNETFSQLMIDEHNLKRGQHNAQPLRWSAELYNFASQFASQYSCSGKLQHSGAQYGENLAFGYSPLGAINAWYDEGQTYVYGSENTYNHFTAMVWNSTDAMACAYKECSNSNGAGSGGTYIVCSYNPPGNVINHSSQNVFPPISKVIT